MVGNVFISHQTLEQVFTDSVEAGGIEVGGLLVGYLEKGEIHITRAIPTSQGSYTRIPIHPIEIVRAAEKLNPGEQIVGWYHSHPGHGVFFSQEDIESHERFLEFNSNFKALVIDPIQAKRGDPLADCVKFYTVEKGKTLIYDYRLANSFGHHYYDPEDFVFDRNGFAHYRPSIRGGITEADERELRQRMGDLKSERDGLEENYLKLRKRWKSSVNIPKKAFPFLVILLVSIGGLLGLTASVALQREKAIPLPITLMGNPSLDKDSRTFTVKFEIGNYDSTTMSITSVQIQSEGSVIFTLDLKKNFGAGVFEFVKENLANGDVSELTNNRELTIKIVINLGEKREEVEFPFTLTIVEEGQDESNKEDRNEISIVTASFDWKLKQMKINVDFSKIETYPAGSKIEAENILIYLWREDTKSSDSVEISNFVRKDISCSSKICTITANFKNNNFPYMETHKYVTIVFVDSNNKRVESGAISFKNIYFAEIQGTPIVSSNFLSFVIVLHGPTMSSVPSFTVYLSTPEGPIVVGLVEYKEQSQIPILTSEYFQSILTDMKQNTVSVTLRIKSNEVNFFRGKSLYVVIHIWGSQVTSPVKIS